MTALKWEVVVGKEMGEEGAGEEVCVCGGGGLAFFSGIFLSVFLSFFSFSPLRSHSMDGDTVIKALQGQTIWPRQWPPVQEGGWGWGGGQGHRGRGGRTAH